MRPGTTATLKSLLAGGARASTFALLLLIAGCESPTPLTTSTAPSGAADLVFFDSDAFDNQLSAALKSSQPQISLKPVGQVSVNAVPPRLNAWLAAAQQKGSSVSLVAKSSGTDGKETQFIQFLAPIATVLFAAFLPGKDDVQKYLREADLYAPLKQHVVFVDYEQSSGMIQQVRFTKTVN